MTSVKNYQIPEAEEVKLDAFDCLLQSSPGGEMEEGGEV